MRALKTRSIGKTHFNTNSFVTSRLIQNNLQSIIAGVQKLSVVTVVWNSEKEITRFLSHVTWADEIIIVDNGSTDRTVEIAQKFNKKAKIFTHLDKNLGRLKQFALRQASKDWILLLDVDELVTPQLQAEIKSKISHKSQFTAYSIPYENHFLGHPLVCRAQQYSKIRLFRRGRGVVTPVPVHEEVEVSGKVGKIEAKLEHFSFRSLWQIFRKFTYYAKMESPLLLQKGERVTAKKLILYPPHMFWAIFIKDEGYKDGIWGFGLAASFAYYEFARYFFLLIFQANKKN